MSGYSYTIDDLGKISGIRQKVNVIRQNGSKITGRLSRITEKSICIKESGSGLMNNIPNTDICRIDFNMNAVSRRNLFDELNKLKRRYDKESNDISIGFAHIFKEELLSFSLNSKSSLLKTYISDETDRKSSKYMTEQFEDIYREFMKEAGSSRTKAEIVVETLLLLRMRKIDKAVACILKNSGDDHTFTLLMMSCLFIQSKNAIASLYWLNRFFECDVTVGKDMSSLWWYCMSMTSKYSSYDQVIPILEKTAEYDPALALESLIYLLVSNNSAGLAANLLQYRSDSLETAAVNELIGRNKSFLVTDEDNNYHRFVRCISEIIRQSLSFYESDDDIDGFVYEFVPDRGFGFIIGFDLVIYFFIEESIVNKYLESRIHRNICSMSHVINEELVMTHFKRTNESKRSYNAIDLT